MEAVIATQNLTKRYGKARGITDIDLTVEKGEIFGFIGPNGAGKSTTIRTLLGLIKKTSGSAQIFGMDIESERSQILQRVGYLPSEVEYYKGMRAKDLLKYAASFYDGNFDERIGELSQRLDLDVNKKIEDMSLGNRKKVGIVQGLLHSPDLIILDEPTSGLDPLVQRTFFDIIREENERGATVLFSSHILSDVKRICDRVGIIKEGKLVAVQSIADLQRDQFKRVRVELAADTADAADTAGMADATMTKDVLLSTLGLSGEDVQAFEVDGTSSNFLFAGVASDLVAALMRLGNRLADVEVTEPSLEEIFMHYYSGDDADSVDADSAVAASTQKA
jgi:ABC-2 type transport system ATP-binding protein